MQKTKIEWCDYTWNPVTGCLKGCSYCYAHRLAHRFGSSFEPAFHGERLEEPRHLRKPSIIFVCSMADLFGDWAPQEWIKAVFAACEAAPQHIYIFLTKNPMRYEALALSGKLPTGTNYWFGSTVTRPYIPAWHRSGYHSFASIEPILDSFEDTPGDLFRRQQWIIVGAQTGPGEAEHRPQPEWIDRIVQSCGVNKTPVFLKNSLTGIYPGELIQETPHAITDYAEEGKRT